MSSAPSTAAPTAAVATESKSADQIQAQTVGLSVQKQQVAAKDRLFYRWRPSFHVLAPNGWMNDPCGPTYDARTGLYHLFYQWNPKGSVWGNMSWGHTTSKNLVQWHSSRLAVIEPGTEYDHKGVFTGCVLPRSITGMETRQQQQESTSIVDQSPVLSMTAIYTAVSHLPIHHTLDYRRGAEKLALSTSTDGGQTWTPHGCILDGPPDDVDVISWRDPYVSTWPLMDRLLEKKEPALYGLIAGGIKDQTPTVFAYSIDPDDLSCWNYIGYLCDVGRNCRSPPNNIDMGKNWEVCNFFSIPKSKGPNVQDGEETENHYLLINVEGCNQPDPQRSAICMRFDPTSCMDSQGKIRLTPISVDRLDHGCLYAASSFHDPVQDRRIVWGWITEDDLPEDHYDAQGWAGCMSLPRQLFDHPRSNQLGIRPIDEVRQLRQGANYSSCNLNDLINASTTILALNQQQQASVIHLEAITCRSFEIFATLTDGCGLVLAHSKDLSTRTLVYLDNQTNQVIVDRSLSCGKKETESISIINTCTITAPIPVQTPQPKLHTLNVFLDNSVLEVYVDELVVISTRIYPDQKDTGLSVLIPHYSNIPSVSGTFHIWQDLAQSHLGFL